MKSNLSNFIKFWEIKSKEWNNGACFHYLWSTSRNWYCTSKLMCKFFSSFEGTKYAITAVHTKEEVSLLKLFWKPRANKTQWYYKLLIQQIKIRSVYRNSKHCLFASPTIDSEMNAILTGIWGFKYKDLFAGKLEL